MTQDNKLAQTLNTEWRKPAICLCGQYQNGKSTFLNCLLQENEEIAVKRLEDSKQTLDYMGCMLDICTSAMKKAGTSGAGSTASAADVQTALAEAKTTLSTQGAGSYGGSLGQFTFVISIPDASVTSNLNPQASYSA